MATLTEHEAARKEKLGARVNFLIDNGFLPHTDGAWRRSTYTLHCSCIESWPVKEWEIWENIVEHGSGELVKDFISSYLKSK